VKKKSVVIVCLLLLTVMVLSGCNVDVRNLLKTDKNEDKLVKVEVVFTDGQTLVTYVKSLGLESDARVYVGGASTNNFYDARGNIAGAFNYQRVLYIKILPEVTNSNRGG